VGHEVLAPTVTAPGHAAHPSRPEERYLGGSRRVCGEWGVSRAGHRRASYYITAKMLGHETPSMARGYARLADPEFLAASKLVAKIAKASEE
jgi:hypothetical protein